MPSATVRRLALPPSSVRRVAPRWAGPTVMIGLALVLIGVFGGAYWDGYQLRREAARLAREGDELRRENVQLREELRLLNTPEHIERLAREQLGLVRPGEIAVILVRPTPSPAPRSAPRATPQQAQRDGERGEGWWARLRRRWVP